MYWPTNAANIIALPAPLAGNPLIALRPNRRGSLFATLSKDTLGVWDVRPTVLQAVVTRSRDSLERWGENADVVWTSDGRGISILTSTSHLLVYQLQSTSQPAYEHLSTNYPPIYGPGEAEPLVGITLKPLGAAFIMGSAATIVAQPHSLVMGLKHPPSITSVPWPIPTEHLSPAGSHFPPNPLDGGVKNEEGFESWDVSQGREWLVEEESVPVDLAVSRTAGLPTLQTMITSEGRVYAMYHTQQVQRQALSSPSTPSKVSPSGLPAHQASAQSYFAKQHIPSSKYTGQLLHPLPSRTVDGLSNGVEALGLVDGKTQTTAATLPEEERAVSLSINPGFGLVAIGLANGTVQVVSTPEHPQTPRLSHTMDLKHSANLHLQPGRVTCLAWTSDGYALAVGYEHAWAVWSMGGRLGGWGMASAQEDQEGTEGFMGGVKELFWAPGNLELFILARARKESEEQLYVVPFAKSATTSQHSPDNTRYAFLQMDDRVLVYRGADQPDMSVINPESDVWQHIKIPDAYIATNWPIRYASISNDGKLIAVAGRRGLTHYSTTSGRWKLFADERQERDFVVRGGLLWFHHVLVAAIDVDKSHQIRLYSRDTDLADQNILHSQTLPAPVLVMSLLDNSLLVYTADNTLYHFLILPTRDTIKLHVCGSISFAGIVPVPSRVRALSWLIPLAQKDLGDPADDLIVATIIFLVDGKLVLLRPRKAGNDEVRYDMQVLADRIESYWTHLHGVGTLENSLWGFDGSGMRVWLDALTIEATKIDEVKDTYENVKESVYLRLDFYPLSILMDKGIIIGVDYETSTRSLPFALFKIQTGTHLFLPPFLRYHLSQHHLVPALTFAVNYSSLVYFAHSLEILLHSVLEDEVDSGLELLPLVIEFLDHFPESLDVVVGCARKTEVERWGMLFDVVGKPRGLFEKCLEEGMLKTAAGYLLVLQNLEELDDVKDTVRVLRLAMAAKEYHLCKEVLRFLHSIDDSGTALRAAIKDVQLLPHPESETEPGVEVDAPAETAAAPTAAAHGANDNTAARAPIVPPQHIDLSHTPRPDGHPTSLPPSDTARLASPNAPLTPVSPALSSASSNPAHRLEQLRSDSAGRISSPFQLSTPRFWTSPPSPRTVDVFPDQPAVPTPPEVGESLG